MKGSTKRFFEDMFILSIVIVVIIILYYVVSNFFLNKDVVVKSENQASVVEQKIEQPKDTFIVEELNTTKEDKKESKNILEEKTTDIEKSEEEKIIDENTEKKVDIQKLKEFISDTEEQISKNIDYTLDTNTTTKEEYLKIRLTLLKSGEYEQLKFIDGNEELFEKNKENIIKVFPLSIDKEIAQEFPRYLRIELKKQF